MGNRESSLAASAGAGGERRGTASQANGDRAQHPIWLQRKAHVTLVLSCCCTSEEAGRRYSNGARGLEQAINGVENELLRPLSLYAGGGRITSSVGVSYIDASGGFDKVCRTTSVMASDF